MTRKHGTKMCVQTKHEANICALAKVFTTDRTAFVQKGTRINRNCALYIHSTSRMYWDPLGGPLTLHFLPSSRQEFNLCNTFPDNLQKKMTFPSASAALCVEFQLANVSVLIR